MPRDDECGLMGIELTKLTDNDKRFGPLTIGRSSWKPIRVVFSTGGDDDEEQTRNSLTAYAFGWVVRLRLPIKMQPHRIKHIAESWDAATIERMGRNWYYEVFAREYGFSYSDGFFQIFYGPQTHSSVDTKSWSKHLPWTQWRFYRLSYYDLAGAEFFSAIENRKDDRPMRAAAYKRSYEAKALCPTVKFEIDDFDGERITATTRIDQREWKFGEGSFRWLSWFRKPLIRRSLDIDFDKETGPEKGSWKGGTCGTSIDMLPGELHEAAFKRYCQNEHRSKYNSYKIIFIGQVEDS